MKTNRNIGLTYILMVIVQMFICNYFHFSMYVTLSMLPAMVLCIPLSVNTSLAMVIAFATGLATDVFSDAVLGLNAMSLVPVALARKYIIRTFIGEETVEREESFSFRKNGLGKVSASSALCELIFFAIYIIMDGAGTRPVWFNISRLCASMAASYILSLIAIHMLSSED